MTCASCGKATRGTTHCAACARCEGCGEPGLEAADRRFCRRCRRCEECGAPIPAPKRKYCEEHSAQASAIWKRRFRAELRARGERYYVDYWESAEARRAYQREATRRWRARKKARAAQQGLDPGGGREADNSSDRPSQHRRCTEPGSSRRRKAFSVHEVLCMRRERRSRLGAAAADIRLATACVREQRSSLAVETRRSPRRMNSAERALAEPGTSFAQ